MLRKLNWIFRKKTAHFFNDWNKCRVLPVGGGGVGEEGLGWWWRWIWTVADGGDEEKVLELWRMEVEVKWNLNKCYGGWIGYFVKKPLTLLNNLIKCRATPVQARFGFGELGEGLGESLEKRWNIGGGWRWIWTVAEGGGRFGKWIEKRIENLGRFS